MVRFNPNRASISFTVQVEAGPSIAQREALNRAIDVKKLVDALPALGDFHHAATHDGPLPWHAFVGDDVAAKNTAVAPLVRGMNDLSAARMTGLENLADDLALRFGRGKMKNVTLVSIMHLFPTSPALFSALETVGIAREKMHISGKNYSTHVNASEGMRAVGHLVDTAGDPTGTAAAGDAADALSKAAAELLAQAFAGIDPSSGRMIADVGAEIMQDHFAKVFGRGQVKMTVEREKPVFLLLDEGGMLLKALHAHFPAFAKHCVAVEHTDRGLQVLEEWQQHTPLSCPLVDMARSPVKKDVEGPLIGESVAFHLERQLAGVFHDPAHADVAGKRIAVVGYGAVGEATAKSLAARGADVVVVDVADDKRAAAVKAGFTVLDKAEALRSADVVVGCTGRQSVDAGDLATLKAGCVLVNAASGNHEFATATLETTTKQPASSTASFNGAPVTLHSDGQDPTFAHRVLTTPAGNEVLALRGGYVVNMVYGMPPEWVQLTLGLDVVSCVQAVQAHGLAPGVRPLNGELQDLVVAHVDDDLTSRGLSLSAPDFRAVAGW